ncbi:PIG-L family deacetylase [Candidatus Pelagibacter sp.]|nr:PIG-L family deacetylase [Candidatus Pelagibacter sp.]
MTNLIIVAHPDDEILGFGGTGAKLVKQGEVVQSIILCGEVNERTNRPDKNSLIDNIYEANKLLGFNTPVLGNFPNLKMNTISHIEIVKFIEQQILKFQPKRIFTHHPSDLNNDHYITSMACLPASRLFQRREDVKPLEALYFMEILSSTDWSFSSVKKNFEPDTFVDITETLALKLKALSKYKNVMRSTPHPRSKEVLTSNANSRGAQCNYQFAEAFQLVFKRGV